MESIISVGNLQIAVSGSSDEIFTFIKNLDLEIESMIDQADIP